MPAGSKIAHQNRAAADSVQASQNHASKSSPCPPNVIGTGFKAALAVAFPVLRPDFSPLSLLTPFASGALACAGASRSSAILYRILS